VAQVSTSVTDISYSTFAEFILLLLLLLLLLFLFLLAGTVYERGAAPGIICQQCG
jgi:hypothetical protein